MLLIVVSKSNSQFTCLKRVMPLYAFLMFIDLNMSINKLYLLSIIPTLVYKKIWSYIVVLVDTRSTVLGWCNVVLTWNEIGIVVGILPAIIRLAFLLTASPTEFLARHLYTPSSLSFFPRTTLEKEIFSTPQEPQIFNKIRNLLKQKHNL